MELDLTQSMFKTASIFSLVSAGRGNVLASGNPIKDRDTLKGKYETMKLMCSAF